MKKIKKFFQSWGRRSPTSLAVLIWGLFVCASYIHLWAPKAYAHFQSCQTPFTCTGGILDFTVGAQVPLEHGGTEADLSATGGAGEYVQQSSSGGALTVGAIAAGHLPSSIDATKIGGGGVTSAEFDFLGGVTSDAQSQIDGKLSVAGDTMTGQLVLDDLMLEFTDSDTAQTCGAGNYGIYADLSETQLKKCVNGTVSDLDTSGGSVTVPDDVGTTTMDLNADSLFINIASGMLCATDVLCEVQFSVASTLSNLSAKANKAIGGTNNTIELATGTCASAKTFDCQAGDLCVTVASTGSDTPTTADTSTMAVAALDCVTGKVTATGDTNDGVLYAISWTKTAS